MFPNYPGGHGVYQDFEVKRLRDHYADPTQLPSGLLDIAERFWQKDLTGVNTIMREVYSPFGPWPRPACCMLRSYLLSIIQFADWPMNGLFRGKTNFNLRGLPSC